MNLSCGKCKFNEKNMCQWDRMKPKPIPAQLGHCWLMQRKPYHELYPERCGQPKVVVATEEKS